MFGIGPMELALILVVALLVLGPKRLPELARTLGRGMGEFRRASNDLRQSLALDELQNDLRDGLAGENSIHRPAQAGDALPDNPPAEETEAAANPADPNTAREPHPGELPLDNDYEHNEMHTEPESADSSPGADLGDNMQAPPSQATKGDSELGNIPVTRPAAGAQKSDPERG